MSREITVWPLEWSFKMTEVWPLFINPSYIREDPLEYLPFKESNSLCTGKFVYILWLLWWVLACIRQSQRGLGESCWQVQWEYKKTIFLGESTKYSEYFFVNWICWNICLKSLFPSVGSFIDYFLAGGAVSAGETASLDKKTFGRSPPG